MRLMRFDRAGLIVSMNVDITLEPEEFLRSLLSVFSKKPSQLGYPYGKEVPYHLVAEGKTHQVIEIYSASTNR